MLGQKLMLVFSVADVRQPCWPVNFYFSGVVACQTRLFFLGLSGLFCFFFQIELLGQWGCQGKTRVVLEAK